MTDNDIEEFNVEKEIKKPDIIHVDVKSLVTNIIDPAPIGVFGLAIGAWVLALTDLRTASERNEVRIGWVIWLPSIAQLLAGIYDSFKANVFGATAFIGYSMLWFCLFGTWYAARDVDYNAHHELVYFITVDISFFIFTVYVFVFSMGLNFILPAILFFILCALLSLALQVLNGTDARITGVFLLIVALLSFWCSLGGIVNGAAGGALVPMGPGLYSWGKVIERIKKKQSEKLVNK
ncbi:acetate uptake transporter [Anaeramoeba ignava]|uniref:Acetate uptake transporter n=1 Tax=Anaeramoeba ignava TaxID=1746090 RepID=A0A9Q0R9F6_ANAIG|nr:acetate uptake transporter [Anaeramoeba ignava]|eukprot:Anaeramoba_ignava/a481420_757.p1 GENE.a481420_757~~a481420_757.p1  ORF type:complete len:236 (+),score=58.37 a481420_757:18-725(+)